MILITQKKLLTDENFSCKRKMKKIHHFKNGGEI